QARKKAEQQAGADRELDVHDQIAEQPSMGYDVIEQESLIPRVKFELGDTADLPAHPIALGKVALKFSKPLPRQVVTDVDAQDGDVPEIGSFSQLHDRSHGPGTEGPRRCDGKSFRAGPFVQTPNASDDLRCATP